MKYIRLGTTDIEVSVLGFGAWGIGGRTAGSTSYGDTDDKVSLRALHHAQASGISLFDTSNVYGAGHSERLLGHAFKDVRDKVILATKVGWPSYDAPPDFSAEGMRKSVEASLQRLQTDYIDLLQLHNPPPNWMLSRPDILETLREFISEGKARALGVSVRSPEEANAIVDQPELVVIQANFNMMDIRAVSHGVLHALGSHKRNLIARTPLCFGFLSGQINRSTTFPTGDHRAAWPVEQRERWIEGSEIIQTIADRYSAGPLHEVALRFCLSFEGVASVLSGMMSESEVELNIIAVDKGTLPGNLIQEIMELNEKLTFFEVPHTKRATTALGKT